MKEIDNRLKDTIIRYIASGIEQQVDYEKFYLYSLITHSTAIEALNRYRSGEPTAFR